MCGSVWMEGAGHIQCERAKAKCKSTNAVENTSAIFIQHKLDVPDYGMIF